MPQSLEAALKDCQSGKSEKFGLVYDAFVEKIYRFIYFKTFNKDIAEDLTSKTFLKALEKISQYDPAKGSFSSWLYKIARNNVIDHMRAVKPEEPIEDVYDLSGGSDAAKETDNALMLEEVLRQLENLDPMKRRILIMRLWDELSYKEISEILGIREENCRMIFGRSLKLLRERLISLIALICVIKMML